MLPNNITDKIITLNPTDEQIQTEAFINYIKCAGMPNYLIKKSYNTTLDKVITSVTPVVIELICSYKNCNCLVSTTECIGVNKQLYGDFNSYFLNENNAVIGNSYIELKSGGKFYDNHLMLYIDVYYLTSDLESLKCQERSYNDELGFLYHQVCNAMLVYFTQHDLFI